jgi:hypothetical protein
MDRYSVLNRDWWDEYRLNDRPWWPLLTCTLEARRDQ